MQEDISLQNIARLFKVNLKWLISGTLVCCLAFFIASQFFMVPQYTSSIELYVHNLSNNDAERNVKNTDILASKMLVKTYVVILSNKEVLEQVAESIPQNISAGEVSRSLTMEAVNDTEVLSVSATTADPKLSADICNAVAAVAPDVLERVVKAGAVEVIGKARVPSRPSSPNVIKNSLVGAGIGLLLSALIIFLISFFDNTIKGEEDIKQRFDLSVLGEIPRFDTSKKE